MMKVQTEMTVILNVVIQRTKIHVLCAMNILVLTVISQCIKSIVKIRNSAQIVHLQEKLLSLLKTLSATLNCAMEREHLSAHIVTEYFPNMTQLEITNVDVQAKEHAMYATLQLRIPKLWPST